MKEKFYTSERIFLICSFIVLTTAAVISFFLPAEERTIIPHPEITIPMINTVCAAVCLVLIFFPGLFTLQYLILSIQSISTVLTGYETLDAFLFIALLIKFFCDGFLRKHFKRKVFPLILIWFVVVSGVYPFGFERMALTYATTIFFLAFAFYIYDKLKEPLSMFLPAQNRKNQVNLPPVGSMLNLSDYDLTDRQIKFVKEYVKEGTSYNSLSDTYYVSISTVKKDMAQVFKIFGVKNKEELRILLLQYDVSSK